ncbi:hypothetical protein SteCoe_18536 [Stentor coeruleus]|uniref:Uncharacterized protein n=1 Tax=Stentor coeruleus TaxID=5963 RepID=A0A1R2BWQ2_9CILI|nr:hypothetical protein SteCoe_18536 [Stentor coeruleus]
MSGRKLQLNLPKSDTKRPKYLSAERAVSRTDDLEESSFSEDLSLIKVPQPRSLNYQKSLPSIEKLREVLAKTSKKLSVYAKLSPSNDSHQKSKEISALKKQIHKLECEKKELQQTNKKLMDLNNNLKEPTLDSDINSIKIFKFSSILFGKLKNNPAWNRAFTSISGSESEYFAQIHSENFKQPLLNLLQFICEVSEPVYNVSSDTSGRLLSPHKEKQNFERSFSSMGDDDYNKLIEESDNLAKTIANQKDKIAKICDRVKESMNKSKFGLEKCDDPIIESSDRSRNMIKICH